MSEIITKINDTVKKSIEFIPVSTLDEVLSIALENKRVVTAENKKRENRKNNPIKNGGTDKKSTGVYCSEV